MPPVHPTIRRASLEDAAEVARLAGELGYPTEPDEMRRRLEGLLANPSHHVAVIDGDGDRLRGWVHVEHRLSVEDGDFAEIVGLVIHPSVRRTGMGRRLVRAAEDWASERGVRTITVRSNIARDASHPFYEALGYSRDKTQHVYSKGKP